MTRLPDRIANIDRARAAIAHERWAEAYELLHELELDDLAAEDLGGLAEAAWWMGEQDEALAARTRAYAACAADDDRRAALHAGRLAIERFQRGEPAVGAGWLGKARRHLEGIPEGVEHGFVAVLEATVARYAGQLDSAMALAGVAADVGRRHGDRDIWVLGLHTQGLVHIAEGRISDGLPLLDEAMTSVVAGELTSFFTGIVYCNVIEACLQVADLARAGQWSEAARTWCDSVPAESPFPGLCRVNRAQVAQLRGEWAEAQAEAERASRELLRFDPWSAAHASYEEGEIRRRLGDRAGARACFSRAHELGLDPQPGSALLRLSEGRPGPALAALRSAAEDEGLTPLRRARLLAATLEVALAGAEMGTARSIPAELDALAERQPVLALAAIAEGAHGELALAEGDAAKAHRHLRRAALRWQELRLPYETGRARAALGIALRASGNEEGADVELRGALSTFERLGAAPDAERVRALLAPETALPRGLTAREAEVLRLVAAGRSNREIATALTISEHTVARHLQNMFTKLEVSSRSAATAFAFEHGLA